MKPKRQSMLALGTANIVDQLVVRPVEAAGRIVPDGEVYAANALNALNAGCQMLTPIVPTLSAPSPLKKKRDVFQESRT